MTEMEKNFKDLENLYKLGMLDAEGYAFQKKQLEDEMARESEAPDQLTAEDVETLIETGEEALDDEDFDEAFKCFSKAAAQGHAKAQYMLGACYELSRGVTKDFEKAMELYNKAAEQDAQYQFLLGEKYKNGNITPKDDAKAAEWYRKAADRGNRMAEFALGDCCYFGEGVPKDLAKAVEYYRKAEAHGNRRATGRLDHLKELGVI
jgi:TPR repeat protein